VTGVHATAAIRVLSLAAERLRRQGHGTIVVLSSFAAVRPRGSNFVYGAAKAALDAFARGLQLALDGSGVRVLVVRPGFVHTQMTRGLKPAPFSLTAAEAGRRIVEALDGGRDVVYVPPVLALLAAVVRALPARAVRSM
jgi:decaprenylphospho-beta-D-erythro-pentofuranosid-2-ulose 2-reductase